MKKLIALTALFALTAGLTAGEGWLTKITALAKLIPNTLATL